MGTFICHHRRQTWIKPDWNIGKQGNLMFCRIFRILQKLEQQEREIHPIIHLCQNFILKSLKEPTNILFTLCSFPFLYLDPRHIRPSLFVRVYPNRKVSPKPNTNRHIMTSSMFSLSFIWCVPDNPRVFISSESF